MSLGLRMMLRRFREALAEFPYRVDSVKLWLGPTETVVGRKDAKRDDEGDDDG